MRSPKTIDHLIAAPYPHGKTARLLRAADADFYAGLAPLAESLAEDIMLAGGSRTVSFDERGRPESEAALPIERRARQHAAAALAGFSGGAASDSTLAPADRAAGLAAQFLRAAASIADFYEQVLPEIIGLAGTLRPGADEETLALGLRDDFARRLTGPAASDAAMLRAITQPYYSELCMGGTIEQFEARAVQLAACRLDHSHVPPEAVGRYLRRVAALD